MALGDFDADGLTGLAILTLVLRRLGLSVEPYVPDRTGEGHGLSAAAVRHAADAGHRLIVTADTGSTSVGEIAAARAAGIDVIVTDHHVLGAERPDALALVNAPEIVFLDDIGPNLKPARAMGMTTIKVDTPEAALTELGTVLGMDLLTA